MASRNFQWTHDQQKWTKIVIPSGTVDPGQSTVIQIPDDLQHSEVIVARNRNSTFGNGNQPEKQARIICPATTMESSSYSTPTSKFQPPATSTPNQSIRTAQQNLRTVQPPETPGEEDQADDDNMMELTTPIEQEMIRFVNKCDRERERLYVMPISKKMRLLEQMEYIETGVVRKDLKEFQETRRKLVFDLQSILSTLPNVKSPTRNIASSMNEKIKG